LDLVNRDPAISIIDAGAEPATLLELLEAQAQATGERQAFGFLVDGFALFTDVSSRGR
jgi:hypothetical protein